MDIRRAVCTFTYKQAGVLVPPHKRGLWMNLVCGYELREGPDNLGSDQRQRQRQRQRRQNASRAPGRRQNSEEARIQQALRWLCVTRVYPSWTL